MNFMERFRAGDFADLTDDEINDLADDEVDAWHEGPAEDYPVHLHEHLGMTFDEFARWAKNPSAIRKMVSP